MAHFTAFPESPAQKAGFTFLPQPAQPDADVIAELFQRPRRIIHLTTRHLSHSVFDFVSAVAVPRNKSPAQEQMLD
jgi:hypothetical protein